MLLSWSCCVPSLLRRLRELSLLGSLVVGTVGAAVGALCNEDPLDTLGQAQGSLLGGWRGLGFFSVALRLVGKEGRQIVSGSQVKV